MSKKPQLSILIYSLAGGGAERVVSILLHELREYYNITLVLMRDKIDYDIPEEIHIVLLENSNPYEHGIIKLLKLPFLGWKYKQFCKKNNIDISLVFMNRPSYIAIFAKLFGNRIKTIISERTTPSIMYQGNSLLSKISRYLIRNLYPKADTIITNSEGNRLDLIEHFNIDEKKIQTIYNPFDLNKIEALSKTKIENVHFDKFTFVTAGRLDEGKNHKLIIDAFAALDNQDTQLIILGEGVLANSLKKQINRLGLQTRVFLVGFDNNPYKYFLRSNVFVFASRYEGFPNVLVEALACGLPVISSDCKSGPREILSPYTDLHTSLVNENEFAPYGILTPVDHTYLLKQAMEEMMRHDLRDNYKRKSRNRAAYYDKKNIVSQYLDILQS